MSDAYTADVTADLQKVVQQAVKAQTAIEGIGKKSRKAGEEAGFLGSQLKKMGSSTIEQARGMVLSYVGVTAAIGAVTAAVHKKIEADRQEAQNRKDLAQEFTGKDYTDPVAAAEGAASAAAAFGIPVEAATQFVRSGGQGFTGKARAGAKQTPLQVQELLRIVGTLRDTGGFNDSTLQEIAKTIGETQAQGGGKRPFDVVAKQFGAETPRDLIETGQRAGQAIAQGDLTASQGNAFVSVLRRFSDNVERIADTAFALALGRPGVAAEKFATDYTQQRIDREQQRIDSMSPQRVIVENPPTQPIGGK
jgi:hypothetical protein